jgi:TolA-binding protein
MFMLGFVISASAFAVKPGAKAPSKATPKSSETPDAQRDYERAKGLVDAGQESSALLALGDFLRRHPMSAMADDAQYLTGEVYFRKRDFGRARDEFSRVFDYKGRAGTDRIPDAAVRLGEAWAHEGQSENARIEWEAVLRTYPKTSAAKAAEERLAGEILP